MRRSEEPEVSEMNEIEAAARAAKRVREAGEEAERERAKQQHGWPVGPLEIGLGIGSAALAAALLYVSTNRRKR